MQSKVKNEQGFVAFTLILAVGALSLAAGYVATQNRNARHKTRIIENDIAHHTSELTNLSHLGRFRSLVATSRLPSGEYEAPIYPINYFAASWQWDKNAKIDVPGLHVEGSRVTFGSASAGVLKIASAHDYMNGQKSSLNLVQEPQDIDIVAQNPDATHPYYIRSIDVTTKRAIDLGQGKGHRDVQTTGRIPLLAPVPSDLKILVRAPDQTAFTELTSGVALTGPAGPYVFQLRASGVVHYAELYLNGKKYLLGIDPKSWHVTHAANNIHARNALIGEITTQLGGGGGSLDNATVNFDQCQVGVEPSGESGSTGGASVTVSAHMYSVAGEKHPNEGGILNIEGPGIPSSPAAAGCEDMCPLAFRTDFWPDPLTQARFLDLAVLGDTDTRKLDFFEPELSGLIEARTRGVICSNMELVGQAMVQEAGQSPTQLLLRDQARYEDLRNKNMNLKRFFAYTAPSCKRQLIGQRTACGCFAEDTRITMGDGSVKAVMDIREGDLVWNPKKQSAQMVTRVIAGPEKRPLYRVATIGNTVTVTHQHPFATAEGIKAASELQVGDRLDGEEVVAVDIIETSLGDEPTVWNLELLGSDEPDDHMVLANGIPTADLFVQEGLAKSSKALAP